jgi:subtilisin family serine protease
VFGVLLPVGSCFRQSAQVETPASSRAFLEEGGSNETLLGFQKESFHDLPRFRTNHSSAINQASPAGPSGRIEYRILTLEEMGLTEQQARHGLNGEIVGEVSGRKIPRVVTLEQIKRGDWRQNAVPLPQANTLDNWHYQQRLFGVLEDEVIGRRIFVPQTVLLKLRDQEVLAAIRVEKWQELEAIQILQSQASVEYAGLNSLERRMFSPNDTDLDRQWHHAIIGSREAWDVTLGNGSVKLAILDAPFQMDHPDLAANVEPGWDVVGNAPVTNSTGIDHSTGAAGLAAAVINNGLGVAGIVNCKVLPIRINGTLAEMYLGTQWAASNGVRIVNISWTGAQDPIMNYAGKWLQDHARGILAMVGGNDATRLNYTNYATVVAISGTDSVDQSPYSSGPHIDFAAPGVAVYTTATSSGYAARSGTSYATPLFCGVVATIMSINPALGPLEILDLLKVTATDLGASGWDEHYGWGRVDFAKATHAASATLRIVDTARTEKGFTVSMAYWTGANYTLWRTTLLSMPQWQVVPNTIFGLNTNGNLINLTDPQQDTNQAFYRVAVEHP